MSAAESRLDICPTEGCLSTASCRQLGLIANYEVILEDTDAVADDSEARLHTELLETCLRYSDAVNLSRLDTI